MTFSFLNAMVVSSSYGIDASLEKKKQTNKQRKTIQKSWNKLSWAITQFNDIIGLVGLAVAWNRYQIYCWNTCYLNAKPPNDRSVGFIISWHILYFYLHFLPVVGLKVSERGRGRSRGREKHATCYNLQKYYFFVKMSWRFGKKGKFDLRFRNVQFNRLFHNFMDLTEKKIKFRNLTY